MRRSARDAEGRLGSRIGRLSKEAIFRVRDAARWIGISVAGLTLVVAGVIMLFTPGPGVAAILAGLAVWARQFHWARRRLERAIDRMLSRREKLPAFAARFLDERLRRRAIRQHAEAVAKGEDPGPLTMELPAVPDGPPATRDATDAATGQPSDGKRPAQREADVA